MWPVNRLGDVEARAMCFFSSSRPTQSYPYAGRPIPRGRGKAFKVSQGLSLELAYHYFYRILLAKASHRFKRGRNRSPLIKGRCAKVHCKGHG